MVLLVIISIQWHSRVSKLVIGTKVTTICWWCGQCGHCLAMWIGFFICSPSWASFYHASSHTGVHVATPLPSTLYVPAGNHHHESWSSVPLLPTKQWAVLTIIKQYVSQALWENEPALTCVWTIMVNYQPSWTSIGHSDPSWTNIDHDSQVWTTINSHQQQL